MVEKIFILFGVGGNFTQVMVLIKLFFCATFLNWIFQENMLVTRKETVLCCALSRVTIVWLTTLYHFIQHVPYLVKPFILAQLHLRL